MTIPAWVQDAVFYQIFPDRFARSSRLPDLGFEAWDSPPTVHGFKGGDLYGVIERLGYLQDLGINAIYLNPVFASASNHRYHTYDYYNVDPLLGGNIALRELLDAAHQRNIRVVLDGVFNHASRGFWQFHHVLETGAASPYRDWFHFDPQRLSGARSWGAYPSPQDFAAIAGQGSLQAIGYQGWWNLPALPKFNTRTPAVREFLFGVAEHWIRVGIDGWRLDVPAEIDDDDFWREFRRRVRLINPDAYIVAEIWHEAQRWLQGDQFDAVMNYLVAAAALGFFAGPHLRMDIVDQAVGLNGRVQKLDAGGFAAEMDRLMNLYSPDAVHAQLNLLDSHDMPRFLSCAGGDKDSLKLACLFILTIPGAPCIYYGDEIGLEGHQDPDSRRSFPWDEKRWDTDLLAYAKSVISLRHSHAALRRGDFRRLYAAEDTYAFARQLGPERVLVGFNRGDAARLVNVDISSADPRLLFGAAEGLASEGAGIRFTLPARSGAILLLD